MGFADAHLPTLLGNTVVTPSDGYESERKVVADVCGVMTASRAVDLVAYAHGDSADGARSTVTAAGANCIANWPAENDALSRRLAAVAVISLYEDSSSDAAVAAALSCEIAALIGRSGVVSELQARAPASVARLSDARREVTITSPSVQPFAARSKPADLPADEPSTTPTHRELRQYLSGDRSAIRTAATNATTRFEALERLAWRNSEEIDLLWWTLAPRSDHHKSWHGAGEAATLLSGLEAARRMLIAPSARGLAPLLHRALGEADLDPEHPISLSQAIDALPDSSLSEDRFNATLVPAWVTPVLTGVTARRGGVEASLPAVRAPRLQWALQLVNELSLVTVFKNETGA